MLLGPSGTGKTHLGRAFSSQSEQIYFLDDIEALDEGELFSHMNLALTGEIDALLLSAETHPDSWSIAMPDLRSRLKNTPVLQLPEPDDELLEGITRRLFEDRGRIVTKDVLVERLETQAQSDKSDMTKAYVSRHLSRWDEPELF